MQVDVRLIVVAALVLLTICLGIAFTRLAFAIRRDHDARFRRIRRQVEERAMSLVEILLRRER